MPTQARALRPHAAGQNVLFLAALRAYLLADVRASAYLGIGAALGRHLENDMTTYCKDIDLGKGYTFRSMIEGDRIPEVYGWIEKDYAIVKGTGGFYRTPDPEAASRIARMNVPELAADL